VDAEAAVVVDSGGVEVVTTVSSGGSVVDVVEGSALREHAEMESASATPMLTR
jgi:hypothetical protein